jgi:hypothetical protein
MESKVKPVHLVDTPPARPAGMLDLTPTAAQRRWNRIFWGWFGWGGLAVWMSLGFVYNQVTTNAPGGLGGLLHLGLGVLAVLLTVALAMIGLTMAERKVPDV